MDLQQESQNRLYQRATVRFPVTVFSTSFARRTEGVVTDMSRNGIFLEVDDYCLDCDENICIEICNQFQDGGKKIRLLGRVVWSNLFSATQSKKTGKGFGVSVQSVPGDEVDRWITSILAK